MYILKIKVFILFFTIVNFGYVFAQTTSKKIKLPETNGFFFIGEKLAGEYVQSKHLPKLGYWCQSLPLDLEKVPDCLSYLEIHNASMQRRSLEAILKLRCLKSLIISNTKMKDQDIIFLSRHNSLEHFALHKTGCSTKVLKHLSGMKGLKFLEISGKITQNLENLYLFPRLKKIKLHLNLPCSIIWSKMSDLDEIDLSGCITKNTLKEISYLKKLRKLKISSDNLTDQCLAYICENTNIKSLHLEYASISSLEKLNTLKNLTELSLVEIKLKNISLHQIGLWIHC